MVKIYMVICDREYDEKCTTWCVKPFLDEDEANKFCTKANNREIDICRTMEATDIKDFDNLIKGGVINNIFINDFDGGKYMKPVPLSAIVDGCAARKFSVITICVSLSNLSK